MCFPHRMNMQNVWSKSKTRKQPPVLFSDFSVLKALNSTTDTFYSGHFYTVNKSLWLSIQRILSRWTDISETSGKIMAYFIWIIFRTDLLKMALLPIIHTFNSGILEVSYEHMHIYTPIGSTHQPPSQKWIRSQNGMSATKSYYEKGRRILKNKNLQTFLDLSPIEQ